MNGAKGNREEADERQASRARSIARLIKLIEWCGTAPFSKLYLKVISFGGIPATLAFIVSLFVSPAVGLGSALGLLLILAVCRETYWSIQQSTMIRLSMRAQQEIMSNRELANILGKVADQFAEDWWYEKLHLQYWLDDVDTTAGKFKRTMIVRFPEASGHLIACVGKIRIGAQGSETRPCNFQDLNIELTCNRQDVFHLLLPIDIGHEDAQAHIHWHEFTILLCATVQNFESLTLTIEANWKTLWNPLWACGIDSGGLTLEESTKPCGTLLIDVLAPERSADGDFLMTSNMPKRDGVVEHEFDQGEKRFRMRLRSENATYGTYSYSIRRAGMGFDN